MRLRVLIMLAAFGGSAVAAELPPMIDAHTHYSAPDAAVLSPADVVGRSVKVIATTTGGKQEVFQGKVEFVDVRVLEGGLYRVKAEVTNREVDGAWTLLPGTTVKMIIESGAPKLTDSSRR